MTIQVSIKVSDDEKNELFIRPAPYLNLVFVIRGGQTPEFEALLKCNSQKYPFVPKKYYLTPHPQLDESNLGAAGFDKPYNLDHVILSPKQSKYTRLFTTATTNKKKRKRQQDDSLKHHPHPTDGTTTWFEILEQNAGYFIIANLILQRKWIDLDSLFTKYPRIN